MLDAFRDVDDLSGFVQAVRDLAEPHDSALWFRGQRSEGWQLEPGLLREPYVSKSSSYEHDFAAMFLSHAPAYHSPFPADWLHTQILMQHHGCPTRLLDWTEGALVALYFAVHKLGRGDDNVDASVFVLNPRALASQPNHPELQQNVIFTSQALAKPNLQGIILGNSGPVPMFRLPLPILPTYNSPRVLAQKGRFTLHPHCTGALQSSGTNVVRRLRIKADAKSKLFWQLKESGITATTLFPDLDALARELRCHLTSGADVP
jgi:hypothetical protein